MKGGFLILSASMLSACAPYGESIGLSDLHARHASLTARTVQVHGWLTPCHGRSCLMVENRNYGLWLGQATALERRMDRRGDTSVQFPPPPKRGRSVSFGSSASFDREVAPLRDSLAEVIVEARVTDECWPEPPQIDPVSGEQTIVLCADRSNQLEPIRLVKVIQRIDLPSDPEEF